MCRLLRVSVSGYYAWLARAPSARSRADKLMMERITAIHRRSRGTYGAPPIHAELVDVEIHVGKKRVARLMKQASLRGVSRRKWITTTVRAPDARPAPDLVQRQFHADAPNRLRVADITYVPTWVGFVFLTVVLDAYSRKIVGWAMANHLRTELVLRR